LAYTFYNQHIEYKSKIETTTDNEFNFSVTGITQDGVKMEFFVICDVKAKKGDILLDDIKNKFIMSLNNTPIYDIDRLKDNFVLVLDGDKIFYN
jgi:HKD family nuclease